MNRFEMFCPRVVREQISFTPGFSPVFAPEGHDVYSWLSGYGFALR